MQAPDSASDSATAGMNPSNGFISLADLFHIIRQRWILASSSAFAVTALFAIVLLNQKQYEAEASLVVELSADKIVNVQEVVENSVQNSSLLESAMNTHIERLKSRTLAGVVCQTLTDEQRVQLIVAFSGPLEKLDPEEVPDSRSNYRRDAEYLMAARFTGATCTVKHTNRKLVKLLADRYVQYYIQSQLELRGRVD